MLAAFQFSQRLAKALSIAHLASTTKAVISSVALLLQLLIQLQMWFEASLAATPAPLGRHLLDSLVLHQIHDHEVCGCHLPDINSQLWARMRHKP